MARVPAATTMKFAIVALALGGCQVVFPLEEGPGSCPATYEKLPLGDGTSGSYRFMVDRDLHLAWLFAEIDCKKDGPTSHLAVLGSPASPVAEVNVVFQRALALEGTDPNRIADVFIGLSARTGTYRWVTDEPIEVQPEAVPPWSPNDPSSPENMLCAEIDIQSGSLVTTQCEGADAYVCECDDFPEQPANL